MSFSNLYAPEHLIINVNDAEKWESFIENAGRVLLDWMFFATGYLCNVISIVDLTF